MADFETVIKGLECCTAMDEQGFPTCDECPYSDVDGECPYLNAMHLDALELLKEQEPVKPRFIDGKRNHFVKCGNCNIDLMHGMKFCPECGRRVKWDA